VTKFKLLAFHQEVDRGGCQDRKGEQIIFPGQNIQNNPNFAAGRADKNA